MFRLLARHTSLPFSVFSTSQCFLSKPKLSSRQISFLEKLYRLPTNKRLVDRVKHKVVYEFQYIRFPAGLLRSRYFSIPILSVIFLPISFAFDTTGNTSLWFAATMVGQAGIVMAASKYLNNTVGAVWVNKEGDIKEVIVSALDKSGRRIDRSHNPNDLFVHEFPSAWVASFGFVTITVKDSDVVYRMNVKSCKFHDKEACVDLFGKIFIMYN